MLLEFIAFLFIYVGVCGALLTALNMMALEFETSLGWGLACCLFVPMELVWLVTHWKKGRATFFYQLLFILIALAGLAALYFMDEYGYLAA